jgi:hypothetical protein
MAKRPRGLLITESAPDFARLHNELKDQIGPTGAIEEHLIEDLAFILWEIQRLRRLRAELLNTALRDAVRNLMQEVLPRDDFEIALDFGQAAGNLARRWPADRQARAEVSEHLRRFQLDETTIESEALKICAEDYERIERMLVLNTSRRDKLLYVMAEGRGGLFKRLQRASDAVLETDTPQLVARVKCAS